MSDGPQSPDAHLVRARQEFANEIAMRFGSIFVQGNLACRRVSNDGRYFAPVSVLPGGAIAFCGPSALIEEEFLEAVEWWSVEAEPSRITIQADFLAN